MAIPDAYDLERFVRAQNQQSTYQAALGELRRGRKQTHWMWFIFPQLAGLGHSPMAVRYAIASLEETRAYLAHPVLGPRLLECTTMVADSSASSAEELLGGIDSVKLCSSMTLFHHAAPTQPLFRQVIERLFDGKPDAATERLLVKARHPSTP